MGKCTADRELLVICAARLRFIAVHSIAVPHGEDIDQYVVDGASVDDRWHAALPQPCVYKNTFTFAPPPLYSLS